jgi:hypothetical protein
LIFGVFLFMFKKCAVCEVDFYVKPSHFNIRFCCSKKCQNINQSQKKGILNNNYKGGAKTQNCNYCKKDFIPKNPYTKRIFCSVLCSQKASIGRKTDNSKAIKAIKEKAMLNPNRFCKCGNSKELKSKQCVICYKLELSKLLKKKQCLFCNNTIIVTHPNKKYCNKECMGKHREVLFLGDKNPNWNNGSKLKNQRERNTKKHNEWIKLVFERDNYTCQKCNKKGGRLNAHHIYSWSKYPSLRFDFKNGVCLCEPCHKYIHKTKDLEFIKSL